MPLSPPPTPLLPLPSSPPVLCAALPGGPPLLPAHRCGWGRRSPPVLLLLPLAAPLGTGLDPGTDAAQLLWLPRIPPDSGPCRPMRGRQAGSRSDSGPCRPMRGRQAGNRSDSGPCRPMRGRQAGSRSDSGLCRPMRGRQAGSRSDWSLQADERQAGRQQV